MDKVVGFTGVAGLILLLFFTASLTKRLFESVPLDSKSPETTEIILTGDVMLGRTVMTRSLDSEDPAYPMRLVGEKLREADLVFVNLENPIIENCPRHTGGYVFCADPKMIEALTFSGIDVVSLANNHTLNYGQVGFEKTKEYLSQASIDFVGDEKNLAVKEINGVTYGFMGFDFLTNAPTEADFLKVSEVSQKVDVLILGVHWGSEYKPEPNEIQKAWAKSLVASGADVISGHHPHWVQTFEWIGQAPVYYSLGNFVFDQMWSSETRSGVAVRLTYEGSKLIKDETFKVFMDNWAQPQWTN